MTNKAVRRRRRLANKEKPKTKRPKTFKTEASAKKHAEEMGLKDYKIVDLRNPNSKDKKLRLEQ